MIIATQDLLEEVLAAHGGAEQWRNYKQVSAKVLTGGYLWSMKGFELGHTVREMTSTFGRQWTSVKPFGKPDWHMTYRPDRIAIETHAGAMIAEQSDPRETFAGHAWETPWTPVQLGYFNGYAMWTYYNLPFILGEPGFELREIPSIIHEGVLLRGLRVGFPKHVHTHSLEQDLYFDQSGLLRRQDYEVAVAGNIRTAHMISHYINVQGLQFPTRRRVYRANEDGTLQLGKTVVSVDLFDFRLA